MKKELQELRDAIVCEIDMDAASPRLGAAINAAHEALKDPTKDWRIGLSCKPKYRNHELHYERGEILEVLPDGTGGINDKTGVLKIRMQTGRVLLAGADEWVTA